MSSSFRTEPEPADSDAISGEKATRTGKLKIFLGYAAGVGKTFQMLTEAQQLRREGVDVVVGYFEPHARPDTIALLEGLEVVPRRVIEYRGARFEEMDTEAIVRRRPTVCVVDEFAHTNVPGSERGKRWQDVMLLLEAGIDVLTTVNIQHLESLNDQVYCMTGIRVRETVPDWVVQQAAEVVMVDLTPRALLNRLDRGAVYQGEKVERAKQNFFKESTLVALRELALRETAFEVESRQALAAEEKPLSPAAPETEPPQRSTERVLVYVTPEPSAAALIRRGKRVADHLKGECIAVAVCGKELAELSPRQRAALEKNMNFARNLHVPTHVIKAENVAEGLIDFARQQRVTQIYLLRPAVSRWRLPFRRNFVEQLARLGRDMEITFVAERAPLS
ncbi:MAG TPA: sensor histidine kinase KdpD [Bryobacteraceae bacterium]|jgi:two-component system sensor histidine kinase KdpD|nr:sensor histidine kinase KdpD [Bryobacteraceae bacterium]